MKKTTSFEIVRKMGLGYNIGNTFDSFNNLKNIETPDEQIELNGNIAPTKSMIKKIKKYGFKTIRFPVTWMNFIDLIYFRLFMCDEKKNFFRNCKKNGYGV